MSARVRRERVLTALAPNGSAVASTQRCDGRWGMTWVSKRALLRNRALVSANRQCTTSWNGSINLLP